MTRNWTRREWTLAVKAFALFLLLALCSAPARSQTLGSQYFPPVGELLGPQAETLPTPNGNLRDSVGPTASFRSDIRALNRSGSAKKKAAIGRLGYAGNVKAVPYLGAVLLRSNGNPEVRAAAAMALGKIGTWKASRYLTQSTKDFRKEVRFATALALGKIGSLEAVEELEKTTLRDPHWWIRYAGALALGETNSPSAVPALARVLREDLRWQVRQQAARALGEIGNDNAIAALGRSLQDEDPTIRYVVARALGAAGGLESLAFLHDAYPQEKAPLPKKMMASAIKKASSR